MEHFDEQHFEGYLCPKCDSDKIADLQKQTERHWMFEKTVARHARTLTAK
jgi:hypothetical protein